MANHIINLHASVKRLIYVTRPVILSRLIPAPSFPSLLTCSLPPKGPATKILMTSLTCDPSVGNYNICRHDKAAHKDGPAAVFGPALPPQRLCLGSGGEMRSWWGRVGEGGGGIHSVWLKRGRPTTQTDMLTANTNMAKQMVHAYLFRFPFKCTPQLCESALSSIEGRTYQLPSSLLTIKRTFHLGTMRGLLFRRAPSLCRTMFNFNSHRSRQNNTPEVIGLI